MAIIPRRQTSRTTALLAQLQQGVQGFVTSRQRAEQLALQRKEDPAAKIKLETAKLQLEGQQQKARSEKIRQRLLDRFSVVQQRPTEEFDVSSQLLAPGEVGPRRSEGMVRKLQEESKTGELERITGKLESALPFNERLGIRKQKLAERKQTFAEKKESTQLEQDKLINQEIARINTLPEKQRTSAFRDLAAVIDPEKFAFKEAFPQKGFAESFADALVQAERIKTIGAEVDIKKKTEQKRIDIKRDVNSTMNAFRGLVTKKFDSLDEKAFGVAQGAGLLVGGLKELQAALRVKGAENTAAFAGQLVETALQQNKIITGSVRVVQSVFEKLIESYPNVKDPDTFSVSKIAQSVRNTLAFAKATGDLGLQKEVQILEDSGKLETRIEGGQEIIVNKDLNNKFRKALEETEANMRGAQNGWTEEDEQNVQNQLLNVFGPERYEQFKQFMVNPVFPNIQADTAGSAAGSESRTAQDLADEVFGP